jgi:hypothetical protein
VAAIGCAYSLILIPFEIITAIEGKRVGGTCAARFHIFIDVVSIPSLYFSTVVELLKFMKILV